MQRKLFAARCLNESVINCYNLIIYLPELFGGKTNMKLGLCLVGAGYIGEKYAKVFSHISDIQLAVICDEDEKRAETLAINFGFRRIEVDWRKAIDSIDTDIVCVCTPSSFHYDIVAFAMSLGKQVLCEKPLTLYSKQSFCLAELELDKNIVAACCYNLIYLPAIQYAKRIVDSHKMGSLVSFRGYYDNDRLSDPYAGYEWRLSNEYSLGGAIGDLGINIISISQYLFGDILSVNGCANTVYTKRQDKTKKMMPVENDDVLHFLMKYKNGAIGSISCNRIALGSKQDMGFTAQFQKGSIRFSLERMNEISICTNESKGFNLINYDDDGWFCIGYEELKERRVKNFLSDVNNRTIPDTDMVFASKIDRIIEAVIISLNTGHWIEI